MASSLDEKLTLLREWVRAEIDSAFASNVRIKGQTTKNHLERVAADMLFDRLKDSLQK